ncbi:hypothetical protein GCM10022223_65040 [Kineosporia mesophila]|uniref:Uncharacterized protein n=1 Tax=Kineosporia mesophila TaxID=566012 RepID=A0ABP7AQF8_9ACTN|nr:HGxxPAAW family protein [Kineosporia mesophila]MCD5349242.1 hypothetical protein [Kineosporia mesophila]
MAGTKEQHPKPAEQDFHDPYGHGHSVAAWVAVVVVLIGSLLATIAVGFGINEYLWLFIVGMVIAVVVGPVAGKVLGAMGFGAQPHSGH